jgi:hypothetical protein
MVDNVPIPTIPSEETITEFGNMDDEDALSDDDACSDDDDDKTVEWEESSQSASANDDDGNTPSEGIGNLDDLVNGIDNEFDDTPLSQTINEYNFNEESSLNDTDTAGSDNDSSLDSESDESIPIGGDAAMRAQVSLLHTLEQSSVPIKMYDKIMDWASEAKSHGYEFPTTPVRRRTVLNNFSTRFQMHEMHSKETVIPLEGGGLGHVTHFNFEAMLKSLLSDPRIRDSLIVNWDNPSKGVRRDQSHVSDIHTAKWFHNTQKRMCTEPNHLLCPIILACDRAHCDEGGKSRLSLEPMLFSLAIIPQELRTQSWAWRPLGYLNNLHLAPSSEISTRLRGQNIRNTHRMLRLIFADIHRFQKEGGITLTFIPSASDRCGVTLIMKIVIAFIIGDCKGHDVLCGRYASHSIIMLCRDCDCTLANADNHKIKCKMRKLSDIKELTDKRPTKVILSELQSIGQHYVRNAFYDLDFGENPGGIHTATPIEMLHGLELGWFKYALKAFFSLLTPTQTKHFDELSKVYSEQHQHQSDRSFPRTSFPHGFSNVTRLQGHEYVGCLFLSVLVLSSRPWQFVIARFTRKKQERIKQFLDLFHTLLALHSFTKTKRLPRDMFRVYRGETESRASNAIRICVQKFKTVLKRKKGNGTKLTKVHQMLHVAYYIDMFGSAYNWYGSPCESSHKFFVKEPGKKTQRRPDNFEQQSAKRVVESYIIESAKYHIKGNSLQDENVSVSSRPIGGTRFEVHVHLNPHGRYIAGSHEIKWTDRRTEKRMLMARVQFDEGAIISMIKRCYLLFDRSSNIVRIPCFTEHKVDGIIYHGHPLFRGQGQWHDYAYFQWEESEEALIGRIHFFVDLQQSSNTYQMTDTERHLVELFYDGPNYYAIVRSSDGDVKQKSVFISTCVLNTDEWFIPSVSAIDRPCYCVFDSLADEEEDNVMVALPPNQWSAAFLE